MFTRRERKTKGKKIKREKKDGGMETIDYVTVTCGVEQGRENGDDACERRARRSKLARARGGRVGTTTASTLGRAGTMPTSGVHAVSSRVTSG